MSTITKISSSREETDSYASEEKKIEMRRRMQLHARGKTSLSLCSLEELSDQQHAGVHLKNTRFRNTACLPDLDESIAERKTLSDQSLDFIEGSGLLKVSTLSDANKDNSNGFDNGKKTNLVAGDTEDKREIYEKKSSDLDKLKNQESLLKARQAAGKLLVQRSADELKNRESEEISLNPSGTLTKNFENILKKVQVLAADVELQDSNKEKSISNIFSDESSLKFSQSDVTKAIGNIRFLNSFIEALPIENPYRDELLASLTKFNEVNGGFHGFRENDIHFGPGSFEEIKEMGFANDDALKNNSVESTKKDLDAIYSYLEAITATSAAPTLPIMLEKFSKVLKSSPNQAIQRLTVSGAGMDSIELVAREVVRRFDKLFEKIEVIAKKSAKTTEFKNTILDEKEKLRSALLNFERISNFHTARQISEKEQECIRGEKTLIGLIIKSC